MFASFKVLLRIYERRLSKTSETPFTTYLFVYDMAGALIYMFQAAQAACKDGDGSVLISEFESQLSKMKEELFEKQGRIKVNCGWKLVDPLNPVYQYKPVFILLPVLHF